MTGQLVDGTAMLLVPRTEKLNPVAFVNEKVSLPPTNVTPLKTGGVGDAGAGILKPVESAAVKPADVK